jgi:hypothetical protein
MGKFNHFLLRLGRKIKKLIVCKPVRLGRINKLKIGDTRRWNSQFYSIVKDRVNSNRLLMKEIDEMPIKDFIIQTRIPSSQLFGLEKKLLEAMLDNCRLSASKQKQINKRIKVVKEIQEMVQAL